MDFVYACIIFACIEIVTSGIFNVNVTPVIYIRQFINTTSSDEKVSSCELIFKLHRKVIMSYTVLVHILLLGNRPMRPLNTQFSIVY